MLDIFLRNSKWFFVGVVLGVIISFGTKVHAQDSLNNVTSETTGKITEPQDSKHDHSIFGALVNDQGLVVIQVGQFSCNKNEHRAVTHQSNDLLFLGCATVTDKNISIRWETGQTTTWTLPPPKTEKPVPPVEQPGPMSL